MAGFLDRFLNSMKLYDDDDEYEEDDYEEERAVEPAPRRSIRRQVREEEPAPRRQEPERPAKTSSPRRLTRDNVVPMKNAGGTEVCMVKPTALEDAREVCDILLSGRAVVINMEGVHVDLAQRIIDFTSGACFSINGNLQKISKYIFIVSPQSIGLTGDFTEVIEGSQDISNLSLNF